MPAFATPSVAGLADPKVWFFLTLGFFGPAHDLRNDEARARLGRACATTSTGHAQEVTRARCMRADQYCRSILNKTRAAGLPAGTVTGVVRAGPA